jgi:hypothetical protein
MRSGRLDSLRRFHHLLCTVNDCIFVHELFFHIMSQQRLLGPSFGPFLAWKALKIILGTRQHKNKLGGFPLLDLAYPANK